MPANKSLVPIRYPVPVCIERPWECEARLNYSSSWLDQGSYRMYSLAATDLDFKFVQNLYSLNPLVGYEIEEIILLSDESDEQAFITGIDLLQKSMVVRYTVLNGNLRIKSPENNKNQSNKLKKEN